MLGYSIPHKKAPLKNDKPVRLSRTHYQEFQEFVYGKGTCQVCEVSTYLDAPHHTLQGAKKDDRSIICICITCHREIHTQGFSKLKKTRKQLERLGADNWAEYTAGDLYK